MTAVIIGGTGLTGSFLVRRLLDDPAITGVVSVSRRSLNIANAKLTEVSVSDPAELPSVAAKLRGEIFCCLDYIEACAAGRPAPGFSSGGTHRE